MTVLVLDPLALRLILSDGLLLCTYFFGLLYGTNITMTRYKTRYIFKDHENSVIELLTISELP